MDYLSDEAISDFLSLVRSNYCVDFTGYSRESIRRRLALGLSHLGLKLKDLESLVAHEPTFARRLIGFLTVGTTAFFRDPSYFNSIRKDVVPYLRTHPYPKIWVAGCSTGEEVVSLAIVLKEEGILERSTIYATDINSDFLKTASQRTYPFEKMALASRSYLQAGGKSSFQDYYDPESNKVVFRKELFENVVFADHCLITDSAFSDVFFVSCRNVLIYFDREFKSRALNLFFESLHSGGILGLGSSESLRGLPDENRFIEWTNRCFYRKYE